MAGRRPLRVGALVKQVPATDQLALDESGRLVRGTANEMNAFCRRAVSQAIQIARDCDGEAVAVTMGPPSARDVLSEAIACGIDRGIHLCDRAFAGSDTLVSARALAAALEREGPFDLVLVGRGSADSDTGSIGPQLAELLRIPFGGPVRSLGVLADGRALELDLQQDGVEEHVRIELPAVLSAAERLCTAASAPRADWPPDPPIVTYTASELGPGPWGIAGSRTRVGPTRRIGRDRAGFVLQGSSLATQVHRAVDILVDRGTFAEAEAPARVPPARLHGAAIVAVLGASLDTEARALLGAAAQLAAEIHGHVVAVGGRPDQARLLAGWGADRVLLAPRYDAAAVAAGLVEWSKQTAPWAVLATADAWGREVTGRVAAGLDAGLIADALGLRVYDGRLVGEKAAFGGQLAVDIHCTSPVQCATVRPGVYPLLTPRRDAASVERLGGHHDRRITRLATRVADPDRALGRARVVIGVGLGVAPQDYPLLGALLDVVDGELGATRKVTDRGWLPHSRQIGATGRAVAPRLYIALGISGAAKHLGGLYGARSVLAVNVDSAAPIFCAADVGIVADWRHVVPRLVRELSRRGLVAPDETVAAAIAR
jgi:electron transfer flavoprotein alpha subunit